MAEKSGTGQLDDVETGSSSTEIRSKTTPTTPDEKLNLEENSATPQKRSKKLGILLKNIVENVSAFFKLIVSTVRHLIDLGLISKACFPVCFIIWRILGPKKWTIGVLFEWIALVCFNGCLIASLMYKPQNHLIRELELWKWCVLLMVVFCGRLIAEILGNVIFWSTRWLFAGKLNVLYIVYGFKLMSSVFVWWSMVLVAWLVLVVMDENGNGGGSRLRSKETTRMLDHVTSVLAYLSIGSGLWLVKDVLLWSFALSFQNKSLFYRILEAIFFKWVIKKASGSNVPMPIYIHQIQWKREMKRAKASAVLIQLFIDVTSDNKILSLNEDTDNFKNFSRFDGSSESITREKISEDFLIDIEDVDWWLELVGKTLKRKIVINSTSGGIKIADFQEWLRNAFQECRSLEYSLHNTRKAMKELNKLASGIVIVLIIIVLLFSMKVFPTDAVHLMLQVLVLTVVFGDTLKKIFEGIIFVFVTHPFDVGDRCVIENGEEMFVKKINIHTTVFSRTRDRVVAVVDPEKHDHYDFQKDDMEKIVYPNSVLATKYIRNFRQGIPAAPTPPNMTDSVQFIVDASTSEEQIKDLEARIIKDMRTSNGTKHHCVSATGFEDGGKIKMAVYFTYKYIKMDNNERSQWKSETVLKLKKILEEMGIANHHYLTPQSD